MYTLSKLIDKLNLMNFEITIAITVSYNSYCNITVYIC